MNMPSIKMFLIIPSSLLSEGNFINETQLCQNTMTETESLPKYYELLGVEPLQGYDLTFPDYFKWLRRVDVGFLREAKDLDPSSNPEDRETFLDLAEAYHTLADINNQTRYDRTQGVDNILSQLSFPRSRRGASVYNFDNQFNEQWALEHVVELYDLKIGKTTQRAIPLGLGATLVGVVWTFGNSIYQQEGETIEEKIVPGIDALENDYTLPVIAGCALLYLATLVAVQQVRKKLFARKYEPTSTY
jgi:hypothetical protein